MTNGTFGSRSFFRRQPIYNPARVTRSDVFQELENELAAATARARRLIEETDGRCFTVRPSVASWSAAECIAHLIVSTELFLPVLRTAIEGARARGITSTRPPSMDLIGRVMRWFLEPPIRSRVKTTAPLVPRSTRAKAEAFGEFASYQRQLVDMMREVQDLDIARMKIVSPFDKRVRYNVYSAFRIIAAHQRRHLWQAEQAIAVIRSTRASEEEAAL